MITLYLLCAAVGGTVLVLQFLLTIIGIGGDDLHFDADVDAPPDLDFSDVASHQVVGHGSTWLFSVISFKTVVAALTFFGIAGWACQSVPLLPVTGLGIAVVTGGAAMFAVHFLISSLSKLNQDGSLRIEASVGKRGRVYLPIPGQRAGEGKIQVKLQGRLVELKAMTSEPDKLPAGARVTISRILTPMTVEVELIKTTSPSAPASGA
ncbi:MAG: hypothetical protein CMJ62_16890 [Planctomycetaceae bacterium]|nr:hypothetical protein [Planctomycetaceae bacterium]